MTKSFKQFVYEQELSEEGIEEGKIANIAAAGLIGLASVGVVNHVKDNI